MSLSNLDYDLQIIQNNNKKINISEYLLFQCLSTAIHFFLTRGDNDYSKNRFEELLTKANVSPEFKNTIVNYTTGKY